MKTTKLRGAAATVAAILLAAGASQAQYKIDWYSINSGGAPVQGGAFKLNFSVGQSVAGFTSSSGFQHWVGFWAGDLAVAQIIGQIKSLPDGTVVTLNGLVATAGATDYADFLYVQDYNRYMGIRVAATPAQMAGVSRGTPLNLTGVLTTTASGERQITNPFIYPTGSPVGADPLAMRNSWVSGQALGAPPAGQAGAFGAVGANNVGLLVTTSGQVESVDGAYVLLDDGSNVPLRVDLTEVAPASRPAVGAYVMVTGASSLSLSGPNRVRTVVARDAADIQLQ